MRTGNELRTLVVWFRYSRLTMQSMCRGDKWPIAPFRVPSAWAL